jgi:hypothetical protein
LNWQEIEPLGAVGADLNQPPIAAGAGLPLGHQHLLDARQMRWQLAAIAAIAAKALRLLFAQRLRALARLIGAEGRVERLEDHVEVPVNHLIVSKLEDRSDLLDGPSFADQGGE